MKKLFQWVGALIATTSVTLYAGAAFAQEGEAFNVAKDHGGWIAIAVAIGIGLAAFGGTFGQGRTAAAALEGIARNPNAADKVFVPMLLGMAFIESLVLFTWVLMLLLLLNL